MLPQIEKNILRTQDRRIVDSVSYQMDCRNHLAADKERYREMGDDVTCSE